MQTTCIVVIAIIVGNVMKATAGSNFKSIFTVTN